MTAAAIEGEHRPGRVSESGTAYVVTLGGAVATAGLTYEFPLSVHVELLAVSFNLTTGGAVANRQVSLQILDGFAVPVFGVSAPATQTASLGVLYSFAPMVTAGGSSALGFQTAPLVPGRLPENLSLSIQVANADAADLITDGRMLVRQWLAGQDVLGGSAAG